MPETQENLEPFEPTRHLTENHNGKGITHHIYSPRPNLEQDNNNQVLSIEGLTLLLNSPQKYRDLDPKHHRSPPNRQNGRRPKLFTISEDEDGGVLDNKMDTSFTLGSSSGSSSVADYNHLRRGIDSYSLSSPSSPRYNEPHVEEYRQAIENTRAKLNLPQEPQTACQRFFSPCTRERRKHLKHDPKYAKRIWYSWTCPPHGKVAVFLTYSIIAFLMWALLWSLVAEDALPGGNVFGIYVVALACLIVGALIKKIRKIRIPPLIGMLLVGLLLRNVPGIDVASYIKPSWSSTLRSMALAVILVKAGIGLNFDVLRKNKLTFLRLSFLPCIFESLAAAILSHFLLGFPWNYGFLMGFVIAAVSPAVVLSSMVYLLDRGYGVDKGVPTLVIAAASVDDVIAISGYGIVLGITFSSGHMLFNIFKGPIDFVVGLLLGIIVGFLCWYLPQIENKKLTGPERIRNKKIKERKRAIYIRACILVSWGIIALIGSRGVELSGAGALCCVTTTLVAAYGWSKEEKEKVGSVVSLVWTFFQPLLFGLLGAEVVIINMDGHTVGLGLALIATSLLVRMGVAFLSVTRAGLNVKEKLFIAIAWIPKATVQAALGSIALDTARDKDAGEEKINLGLQILTIAVLVILITAPVGALAISISGRKLLKRNKDAAIKRSETTESLKAIPYTRGCDAQHAMGFRRNTLADLWQPS